jgi:hypothetical protein
MSKKLNITGITNDLEGSAFFPSKSVPSPIQKTNTAVKKEPLPEKKEIKEKTPVPLVPPVRVEPPVLPVPPNSKKRVMKQRHPFDIYQDQYESLKDLALEDRKQGGLGSMSAMVREAIDELIVKKKNLLKS